MNKIKGMWGEKKKSNKYIYLWETNVPAPIFNTVDNMAEELV